MQTLKLLFKSLLLYYPIRYYISSKVSTQDMKKIILVHSYTKNNNNKILAMNNLLQELTTQF